MSDERRLLYEPPSSDSRIGPAGSRGTSTVKRKIELGLLLLLESLVLGLTVTPIIVHAIKEANGDGQLANNTSTIFDCPNKNNCADGFYESNNTCLPDCNKFQQDTESIAQFIEVATQWNGWFGFCTAIVVIVMSLIKYNFTFPSVFLVYMTLAYCILELFSIITSLNPSRSLYCKHKNLSQSVQDSTNFCKIAGATFHYFFINITLWWFFHVSVLFYKLMLPIKAKLIEKYHKRIHAVLVVLGLILPLPAVVYSLWTSQYTMNAFPPRRCYPRNDVYYYSFILVINVLAGLGVMMFIPMFYTVHKYKGILRERTGSLTLSSVEVKLLFVLSYYALLGIVFVLSFQLCLHDQDKLIGSLKKYFACNYCGIGSDGVCQHRYHDYTHSILRAFFFILMSLLPTTILIFMINWNKTYAFFLRLFHSYRPIVEVHDSDPPQHSVHSPLSPFPDSTSIN